MHREVFSREGLKTGYQGWYVCTRRREEERKTTLDVAVSGEMPREQRWGLEDVSLRLRTVEEGH